MIRFSGVIDLSIVRQRQSYLRQWDATRRHPHAICRGTKCATLQYVRICMWRYLSGKCLQYSVCIALYQLGEEVRYSIVPIHALPVSSGSSIVQV